ncbi:MAG: ORF6N domain-containing protein [Methylotenera sp.]|nr:ORF6N domain-containing protein [Flavobacterium sp.]
MLIKNIQSKIYEIRNQKVMLDFDLAQLYEVETRVLNQAVKRNLDRFPDDFMFQLTKDEWESLKSQFVISNSNSGMSSQIVMTSRNKRPATSLPYAFTEQGVSMLSSILKSKKAVQVNISIMRVFVAVKQMILGNTELAKKLEELETKYNKQFSDVYEALNYLMDIKKADDKIKKRTKIGYKA